MPEEGDLNYPGAYWLPERGKYYRFTESNVLVVRPWPKPQAWFKHNGGPWLSAEPRIPFEEGLNFEWCQRQLKDKEQEKNLIKHQPLGAALATIPLPIREGAAQAYFLGNSWRSLALLGRCSGALNLSQSAPLICALLSNANTVRQVPIQRPLRSARSLLRQPDGWKRWSNICDWLDLDNSRAFIRMTRKVLPEDHGFQWQDIKGLIRTWNSPYGRKRLSHMPRIESTHCELLAVATNFVPVEEAVRILSFDLFDEVSNQFHSGLIPALVCTLRLWEQAWGERDLPRLRSVEQVETLRLETYENARERCLPNGIKISALPFPPPPLHGKEGITPLDSDEIMKLESNSMNHCIGNGSWGRLARMRQGYGYRVNHCGERATLWISRNHYGGKHFELEQLNGHSNQCVSRDLSRFVSRWLDQQTAWLQYQFSDGPRPFGDEPPRLPPDWVSIPIARCFTEFEGFADEEIPF